MKSIFLMLLFFTSLVHADEIGSQYKQQAEAGDARAQYYLADTYFSSGDSKQAAQWAEKAAKGGDVDAMALLSQIQFTQGDYAQAVLRMGLGLFEQKLEQNSLQLRM